MTRRERLLVRHVAILAIGALMGGCGRHGSPVAPIPDAGGVVVAGVVRDTTGAPIANALVELDAVTAGVPARASRLLQGTEIAGIGRRSTPVSLTQSVSASASSVPTDANGAFAFQQVQAGDYVVSATSLHHLADSKTITVPVRQAGAPAETVSVQLRMRTTGSFTGNVKLSGASTHAGTVVYAAGTASVALTDASGAYTLSDVPLGTWTVTASHPGYLDGTTQGTLSVAGESRTLTDLVLARDLNVPPTALVAVNGNCVLAPTRLTANASDPDGSIALYEWDFESDGVVDTSGATLTTVTHSYSMGSHRAKLIVTDNQGAHGIGVANFSISGPDTLYVSSSSGSSSGPGTRSAPYSTVTAALAHVTGPCPTVILVAIGYYPESVVMQSNVVLRGGFDPSSWQRAPGARTEIWVGAVPGRASYIVNTTISDIHFTAADMTIPSTSSIAFSVDHCDSSVVFERCLFDARSGVTGTDGIRGYSDGVPGGSGRNGTGQSGGGGGTSYAYGLGGGSGGSGGRDGEQGGAGGCGNLGGTGGATGTSCSDGGSGVPGPNGPDGVTPNAPTPGSYLVGSFSVGRGADGVPGCNGSGGGGGGGGATCSPATAGGGGGGGGGGAYGGSGGGGGRGGGGSIAMIVSDGSPRFESCVWSSVDGAPGGEGGDGRAGAIGGAGGSGATFSGTHGGPGGAGGNGGAGGGGQGGPGGPSWCFILLGNSNPTIDSPTYVHGSGGPGGVGGRVGGIGANAPSGPTGSAGDIGP